MEIEKIGDKKFLRKNARQVRDSLSKDEIRKKSDLILINITSTKEYKNAENILVYVSTGSEVETQRLIERCFSDRKNVYVPKVYGDDMRFIKITSIDELEYGYYDILEPACDEPVWENTQKKEFENLCIMPGLAFDKNFNRIGYGGGFYDRFIQKNSNVYKMALCFECQITEHIEADVTDKKPDMIVTDMEVMKNGQH